MRELAIREIDLGARGIFYRVQAGYFPDRASALELCTALKARGQDCLVVKRPDTIGPGNALTICLGLKPVRPIVRMSALGGALN